MAYKSILITLPFFCGLAVAAESAAGHYSLVGVMEVGSELLLKTDGSFEFALAYGALDLMSEGKWRQEGDTVILDAKVSEEPLFRQSRSSTSKEPGVRIVVKGMGGAGAERIDVVLNPTTDAAHEQTNREGAAVFPGVHAARSVAFHIPVYDVSAGPFPLDATHNDFEFVINGERITQVPFKNERLKMQNGKLELLFFDPSKPMVYRR